MKHQLPDYINRSSPLFRIPFRPRHVSCSPAFEEQRFSEIRAEALDGRWRIGAVSTITNKIKYFEEPPFVPLVRGQYSFSPLCSSFSLRKRYSKYLRLTAFR